MAILLIYRILINMEMANISSIIFVESMVFFYIWSYELEIPILIVFILQEHSGHL